MDSFRKLGTMFQFPNLTIFLLHFRSQLCEDNFINSEFSIGITYLNFLYLNF